MSGLDEFAKQNAPDPAELRALRREIHNLKRQLRARQGGEDIIVDAVREVFAEGLELPAIPKPKGSTGSGKEEIALVHLSDGQIGKITESYDSAVAEIRVARMASAIEQIVEMRRKTAKIRKLIVVFGGDEVEGENIFPGQAHHIDSAVFDQSVRTAPGIYAGFLQRMLRLFPEIEEYEVPGNHGRAGRKGDGIHPRTNWDNVTHEVLRIMLAREKRIKWHPNTHWNAFFKTWDDGHLVTHGDQIRGGFAGYPWYGVGRKTLAWAVNVREWGNCRRRYFYHGHFHQCTNWILGGLRVLGNGSLESHNEYALENFGSWSDPEQRLAFFNQPHGLIADCPLYLGE